MYCALAQTVLCSRRGLRRLLYMQYSVLFTSSFPNWQRCTGFLHLCESLTYSDVRLQRLHTDRTCVQHPTVKYAEAQPFQTSQGLQHALSSASTDCSGRRKGVMKPLVLPTPAASLGHPLLCKPLSSFPATGKPPAGLQDPLRGAPRDPLSDHLKNQQEPYQASCNDTGSQQAPLLGLKKKSNGPVAVAISGGVDSAVAAMLLKNAG